MGLQDFEVFIQERLRVYDENLDLSSGSPIDAQVIQPLLRRIGTDPFTVDASTFIVERLGQAFPDLAASDGDAISDLLTKPMLLLWDPIIREIQRVKSMLSLRDPSVLTTDEVEALGANIFSERDRGAYAKGVGRIYFAQPQSISVTQSNFFTARDGLHFFPSGVQAIKAAEMLLNAEGELYYFDVSVIAEATGDGYNIGPTELVTIANIAAAVRVTNKVRFRFGLPEEDAVTFAGRIRQDLSEHSLVTQRGIVSRISAGFPEVTRVAVVGFNDPEMQRDVLTGGGLGPMLAFGVDAVAFPDGEFKPRTRRVQMPSADFITAIGPVGDVTGWVLTLFGAFGETPDVRDLPVARVLNATTLELTDQSIKPASRNKAWCLRKTELTLSGIPGGILFPDSPAGTLSVTPDTVHIGGMTDMLVRGADFDTATLVIDVVADDHPLLSGSKATLHAGSYVALTEYVLTTNYAPHDDTFNALDDAARFGYSLEILEGVGAGVYRVLETLQSTGANPLLLVTPTPPVPPGDYRWRLLDVIDIDLVAPKETRLTASTGKTVQNVSVFATTIGTDFDAAGVSVGDVLHINEGLDAGAFTVEAVVPPFYTQVQVDRPFTASNNGLTFSIVRANKAGGVKRPLMRITSIDLLDVSGQPVGARVPFAKPVEGRSRAFQNSGVGVKVAFPNVVLGIVAGPEPVGGFVLPAGGIHLSWDGLPAPLVVPISAGATPATTLASTINGVTLAAVGYEAAAVFEYAGVRWVGIVPLGGNMTTVGTTAGISSVLFGTTTARTSRDILAQGMSDWGAVHPSIDPDLDSVWVLDGLQAGLYSGPHVDLANPEALRVAHDFAPEVGPGVQVGSRSIGSARLYFLEPTSMEVDQYTLFTTLDANNNLLRFLPDPTLRLQKIPALPNGTKPLNGTTSGALLISDGLDFVRKGVLPGDILVIDFMPITGSVDLSDPIAGVALKQLRISLNGQVDRFVTFVSDVPTPGAVSRAAVVNQINAAVGLPVCSIVEYPTGVFKLVFNPTLPCVVRQQNGNVAAANALLGFSNVSDTDNASPNAGEYTILQPGHPTSYSLTLSTVTAATLVNQQFSIVRPGVQRVSSTAMSRNKTTAGLYYWDVQLLSEGVGDLWNIDADQLMVASGFRSDGYFLTTDNSSTSLSAVETLGLHISRSILEVGVDDDVDNITQLSGQSISIDYEYSALVENVQSFAAAESERVVNESVLSRHLIPHFVRFDLNYTGGSRASDILPSIKAYITGVQPDQAVQVSAIQQLVMAKGATSVQNPIDLLAVVYNFDRTITLARSQDELTTGRLAAFLPDVLNLKRRTT